MIVKCISCTNCKNDPLTAKAGAEYCEAGMWDRNDNKETYIHADDDFAAYTNQDRFCSEFKAVKQPLIA